MSFTITSKHSNVYLNVNGIGNDTGQTAAIEKWTQLDSVFRSTFADATTVG